jgi:hypothetical protein
MLKFSDLLNEGPLGTFTAIGGLDKPSSFKDPRDIASLSRPATVQKVKDIEDILTANVGDIFVM